MPDIRLISIASSDVVTMDWLQASTGQLDETQQLATAVMVALGTDARADPSDVLPDPRSDDLRGWWGDTNAATIWNGWPIGSKLWLLTRAKILDQTAREGATTTRINAYVRASLQPLIVQKICSRIDAASTIVNPQRIDCSIMIYRGPKTAIQLEFQPLWQEIFPWS